LVEQRSPKPTVGSSNLSAPAISSLHRFDYFLYYSSY